MSKVRFAAYGTLRKGSYNYDRFKQVFGDNFNYIETKETKGIRMYDSGSYPWGVFEADEPIVVDIIECSNDCFDLINHMERGAGYRVEKLLIDNENVSIFIYNRSSEQLYGGHKIVNKDWIEYEKSKKRK